VLTHAYGPATDLPELLSGLRSHDASVRDLSAQEIRHRLMHQGSRYDAGAAAVPYLIELLADDAAPDRTLGHELLAGILPTGNAEPMPGRRPHPLGPRLSDLATRRCDWYVSRYLSPVPEVEDEPEQRQAYEAVRAGLPTYLRMLGDDDRNVRGLSAHLVSHFPEDGDEIRPVLIDRLAAETDHAVAAMMCLCAGMVGEPGDADLVAVVAARRGQGNLVAQETVLMGLVRLVVVADRELLEGLCDCLFLGPDQFDGWPFHGGSLAWGAASALGELPVRAAPGLADLLLRRLRAGGDDPTRFSYAMGLLLGLVFPDGPLPDNASPARLAAGQSAVAQAVLDSGLVDNPAIARMLRECGLPDDEDTLRRWIRVGLL